MKRILKLLIPCLVACFMVFGLVQNQRFVFAEDQTILEGSDTNGNSDNPEKILSEDDEGTSGGSSEEEP